MPESGDSSVETGNQNLKGVDLPDRPRGEESWNYDAPAKKRLTFRVPEPLLEELELLVEAGVFHNRAEAMRAGLRSVVFGYYDLVPGREDSDGE